MFCAKINNLLDFVMNMVKICTSAGGINLLACGRNLN